MGWGGEPGRSCRQGGSAVVFTRAREGLEFKDCSALAPTVLAPPTPPIPAARLCCKVYFLLNKQSWGLGANRVH